MRQLFGLKKMANTSSGGTQAGDNPANTSLSTEIRSYLLKMGDIEHAKTLSLLKRAKQAMKTLKTRIVMKNENVVASQMMNKMTETMQKLSQKMNNLKKKNSNIMKKILVEMTRNFNAASRSASQKMNKSQQTLNVKMTTMRINNDADKKMFVEKPTRDLMNQIAINCQSIIKMIKL